MRLVVEYGVGDGCTYHCTNTVPVTYESAEAFAVDLEEKCKELFHQMGKSYVSGDITIGGQEFNVFDFFDNGTYYMPSIMTVDEWFQNKE